MSVLVDPVGVVRKGLAGQFKAGRKVVTVVSREKIVRRPPADVFDFVATSTSKTTRGGTLSFWR